MQQRESLSVIYPWKLTAVSSSSEMYGLGTTTCTTCTSTRCLSIDPISGHKNLDLGRFFKVEFRLKSSNCYFKDAGFRTVRYHYGIANPPVDPQLDFNDSRTLQPTVGEKDMLRWGNHPPSSTPENRISKMGIHMLACNAVLPRLSVAVSQGAGYRMEFS